MKNLETPGKTGRVGRYAMVQLNIKTNDCYGREKVWYLKTNTQRLTIQNIDRYDREIDLQLKNGKTW